MTEQYEIVDNVLIELDKKGLLEHFTVIGSWCLYFYRVHFGKTFMVSPLRTLDMDINVSCLAKTKKYVNIPELLKPLGFDIQFFSDGSICLVHPAIKIEFLVPERGKCADGPLKLSGFNITAQPLRFLNILEKEVIVVDYKGLKVRVPHPAYFSVHKFIISQRRQKKGDKKLRDVHQALEVMKALIQMGEKDKLNSVLGTLTKKQKGYASKSLQCIEAKEQVEFEVVIQLFNELGYVI